MEKEKQYYWRLSVSTDEATFKTVKHIAIEQGITASDWVNRAIGRELKLTSKEAK